MAVKYKEIVKRENMVGDMLERINQRTKEMEVKIAKQIADNDARLKATTQKTQLEMLRMYSTLNEKSQESKDSLYRKFLNIAQIMG